MGKYKIILWDVDGCLLSFEAQENAALDKAFLKYNLGCCTILFKKRYKEINKAYWCLLEQEKITKQEVLINRFIDVFKEFNINMNAAIFNEYYQSILGETIVYNDHSFELVTKLKNNYLNCIVTNGTIIAQEMKLTKSKFMFLIDRIYISDKIGYQKPNINFFNYIFDDLNNHQRKDYIIVGDSLTSDILGGKNSGITTVWYNPNHEKNDKNIIPDYEIDNLKKIEGILNDKKSYN